MTVEINSYFRLELSKAFRVSGFMIAGQLMSRFFNNLTSSYQAETGTELSKKSTEICLMHIISLALKIYFFQITHEFSSI